MSFRNQGKILSLLLAPSLMVLVGCDSGGGGLNPEKWNKQNMVATDLVDDALTDKSYRFRLESPSQKWRLMKESEISGLVPDAVAGAININGTYGAIVVEPVGNADLERYSRLLGENSASMCFQVSSPTASTFEGYDAIAYTMHATLNGLPLSYENLVFIRQKFGYQLLTWGDSSRFDRAVAQEFRDAVAPTKGKVEARGSSRELRDYQGVGQRIVDGRFESAVCGVAAQSTDDWKLAIGMELQGMNEDAEFGMTNVKSAAYMVVVPEYVSIGDLDTYRSHVLERMETGWGGDSVFTKHPEPITYRVGGRPVQFQRYTVDMGLEMQILLGVHHENGRAFQIVGWWLNGQNENSDQTIATAFGQIEFLTDDQIAKLTSEMSRARDTQNEVGPEWGLWRGVYRDFELGVAWKKPQGFWRVSVGDEARLQNDGARVFAFNPRLGIYMQMISQPSENWTPEQFHQVVSSNLLNDADAPEPTMIDSRSALISSGAGLAEKMEFNFRVTTTLFNGQAFQFVVWGRPENMKQHANAIEEMLAGFRLIGNDFQTVKQTGNLYEDYRIGFSVNMPGFGWRATGNNIPQMQSIANAVAYKRSDQKVSVMARVALHEGQDESVTINLMDQFCKTNFARFAGTVETVVRFGGLKWNQQAYLKGKHSLYLHTSMADRTAYMMMVEDQSGKAKQLLQQAQAGFRLLPADAGLK